MKRGYADTPQGQIHYTTAGEGEPLLLLHKTGSSRQYGRLMPLLAGRYRVFAPDNLGAGNSDPLPPNVTIPDMARSMIDFLDFFGLEKAHVFGFHTGNKIATEMAAAWPSRLDDLILCGHTHSIMADHEALNTALKAVVASDLRKFEPEPDGSHLVKQWAADFGARHEPVVGHGPPCRGEAHTGALPAAKGAGGRHAPTPGARRGLQGDLRL